MAGFWRITLSLILAAFVTTSTARAFNGRFGMMSRASSSPAPTYSYYYAVPFYYYCPPAGPKVIPVPDAKPGFNFANPIPAPASQTGEPPLHKNMPPAKILHELQKPVIVASHAMGGTHVAGKMAPPTGLCRVGFWNLTNRDVTLMVEGKAWTLPKDRAVTIDLERQFAWQIEGRTQTVERVADGLVTHEVVIRD